MGSTDGDADCESDDTERTAEQSGRSCRLACEGLVVEGHIVVTATVGIVNATTCIPDLRTVHLAGKILRVPVKTRPAVTFVHLCQRVVLRVRDLPALHFTAGIGLIP